MVVHGGDLFFRSRVPAKIVDLVYEPLFAFAEKGIPIFIVPGNHERAKLPESLLLSHPNIHIFDLPKTYTLSISGASIAIAGFPFQLDNIRARFRSVLLETGLAEQKADIKLLCMHQAVEGAQVGPSNYTFRSRADLVRLRDVPDDCVAVLSGHIHRKQILVKHGAQNGKRIPVIYPGSIERTSFAEISEDKGFFEIDFNQAPNNGCWTISRLNFVNLPARPMVDLCLDGNVNKDNLRFLLTSKISRIDRNAIVRLKYNGELDEGVKKILTSSFLREILPETMNFQFGSRFFRQSLRNDSTG